MPKFRKKPVIIEAVQYKGQYVEGFLRDGPNWCPVIETMEGQMRADIGDWIITGVKGERYPCKPDIFAATYEPVDVSPDAQESQGVQ